MELTRFREFKDISNNCTYLVDAKKVCAIIRNTNGVRINLISNEDIYLDAPTQTETIQLYDALVIWWKYWTQEGEKRPTDNGLQKQTI